MEIVGMAVAIHKKENSPSSVCNLSELSRTKSIAVESGSSIAAVTV